MIKRIVDRWAHLVLSHRLDHGSSCCEGFARPYKLYQHHLQVQCLELNRKADICTAVYGTGVIYKYIRHHSHRGVLQVAILRTGFLHSHAM